MRSQILGLIAIGWLAAACTPGTPDIEVAEAHDLGTVIKGAHAIADLPVRNVGNAQLKIVGISTSCGCTEATVTPLTIPAGGEGRLHVDYNSAAHAEDMGRIERLVFIASDDPDEDEIRVRISVFVAKE